jgi:hypothetical protein
VSSPDEPTAAAEPVEPASQPAVPDVGEALTALADAPLAEHVEIYQQVHQQLQQSLSEIDAG